MYVLHRCDNPPCINVEHLFLGTITDNNADKFDKGRQARGQAMGPTSLLSEDDVRAIRHDPRSSRPVASEYGVDRSTITRIRNRKRWAWLE
jgi:hypothetical protein